MRSGGHPNNFRSTGKRPTQPALARLVGQRRFDEGVGSIRTCIARTHDRRNGLQPFRRFQPGYAKQLCGTRIRKLIMLTRCLSHGGSVSEEISRCECLASRTKNESDSSAGLLADPIINEEVALGSPVKWMGTFWASCGGRRIRCHPNATAVRFTYCASLDGRSFFYVSIHAIIPNSRAKQREASTVTAASLVCQTAKTNATLDRSRWRCGW